MGTEQEKPVRLTQEEIKELTDFGAIASSAHLFLAFPILLTYHNDLMKRIRSEKPASNSEK